MSLLAAMPVSSVASSEPQRQSAIIDVAKSGVETGQEPCFEPLRLSQLAHLRDSAPFSELSMNAHKEFIQRECAHLRVPQVLCNRRACLTIRAIACRQSHGDPSRRVESQPDGVRIEALALGWNGRVHQGREVAT